MKESKQYRVDSDELHDLTHGFVDAARINDVMAKPGSKRFKEYLTLIQEQYLGEPVFDHNDRFREEAKELLPNALIAYEKRHGVITRRGLVFFHGSDFQISAAPDAVDSDIIGLTVHIRQSEETYNKAIAHGLDQAMIRHAQAMMLITGLPNWIHLNYWQDANLGQRRLFEHEVEFNERHAQELEEALIGFVFKSRLRAVA
ncbi:MAG: hypothetical protein IIB77_07725 [Proteobacteria bacterium]|nr:hypothetical protein [Pseudomonadota bacterium]